MTTVWNYLEKHDLADTVCEGLDKLRLDADKIDDVMNELDRFALVINRHAKSRYGQFNPTKRTIELTSEYFNNPWDEVKEDHHNTMLHEVAHLVVHYAFKPEDGNVQFRMTRRGYRRTRKVQAHGQEWKMVMRSFGLNPKRCGSSDILDKAQETKGHKHLYTCQGCGEEIKTMRVLKNMHRRHCRTCGPVTGRFNHTQLR